MPSPSSWSVSSIVKTVQTLLLYIEIIKWGSGRSNFNCLWGCHGSQFTFWNFDEMKLLSDQRIRAQSSKLFLFGFWTDKSQNKGKLVWGLIGISIILPSAKVHSTSFVSILAQLSPLEYKWYSESSVNGYLRMACDRRRYKYSMLWTHMAKEALWTHFQGQQGNSFWKTFIHMYILCCSNLRRDCIYKISL